MSARIKLTTAFCFVLSVLSLSQQADAQLRRSRQPLQAPMRWLGQGWSTGYHWQNPGPNSDYYNPYTAHNSFLLSRQPGFQAQHGQYGNHASPSVPYSTYAPTGAGPHRWNGGQGQMIQPSFEPSDPDGADPNGEDDSTAADEPEEANRDSYNRSSDATEPGSIGADDDADAEAEAEDADFEESSAEEMDQDSESGVTNAGFRRPANATDNDLDFSSFMVN